MVSRTRRVPSEVSGTDQAQGPAEVCKGRWGAGEHADVQTVTSQRLESLQKGMGLHHELSGYGRRCGGF